MSKFSDSDVLKLAHAVVDDPIEYYDNGAKRYSWCQHCGKRTKLDPSEDIVHKSECPVLTAQKILS